MKKISIAIALLALATMMTGCAPYRFTVTGATGKVYTAPDICQALVECQNSNEASCLYPDVKTTTQDGKQFDQTFCKEVKK